MATFPERAIAALNAVLTPVADAALAPLISRAPLLLLAVVSALTALAMLFVVRRTSNQAALAAAKRGIRAALFEVRLFHDEPRGVWPALGRMLAANARYLRHTLVPFLWMVLPLTLVVAQLQAFYGYEGLRPGRAVVLRAELRDTRAAASDQMRLTTSAGLQADAEPVRLRGGRELVWRVTPLEAGRHTATLHDGDSGTDLVITLDASSGLVRRSPVRGFRRVRQSRVLTESGRVIARKTSSRRPSSVWSSSKLQPACVAVWAIDRARSARVDLSRGNTRAEREPSPLS